MVLTENIGTKLADGTEQELFTPRTNGPKFYFTNIFLHEMVDDDELEVKAFVWDTQNSVYRQYGETEILRDTQESKTLHIPSLPTKQYKITIKQTSGTFRNFSFAQYEA